LREAEQHLGRREFKIAIELQECPRRAVDPDCETLPCRRGGSGMKSGRLIESRLRLLEIAAKSSLCQREKYCHNGGMAPPADSALAQLPGSMITIVAPTAAPRETSGLQEK
jgi:hypothetical protein